MFWIFNGRKTRLSKQTARFHDAADMSVGRKFSNKAVLKEVIKFLKVHS